MSILLKICMNLQLSHELTCIPTQLGNIYLPPLYLEDTSANHKLGRVTRSQTLYYVLVTIKAYGSLILNFHL